MDTSVDLASRGVCICSLLGHTLHLWHELWHLSAAIMCVPFWSVLRSGGDEYTYVLKFLVFIWFFSSSSFFGGNAFWFRSAQNEFWLWCATSSNIKVLANMRFCQHLWWGAYGYMVRRDVWQCVNAACPNTAIFLWHKWWRKALCVHFLLVFNVSFFLWFFLVYF